MDSISLSLARYQSRYCSSFIQTFPDLFINCSVSSPIKLVKNMAPEKIIIDTDPGIDDILGLLLAFSTTPEEVEVLLVSITFGNVELHEYVLGIGT